jgi:hypothetical protein
MEETMTSSIRRFALPILALALTSCIITTDGGDASITVLNDSDYVLVDIRVSPVGAASWGPNLLRGDALFPGEELTVVLDCDYYDVLVEDELGATCVLADLDLCFSDDLWVIRNSTLDFCGF